MATLLTLPNEIHLGIGAELDKNLKDLNALVRANRRFYNLLNHSLYKAAVQVQPPWGRKLNFILGLPSESLSHFLAAGLDVNAQYYEVPYYKTTLLMNAVRRLQVSAVSLLLSHGADVEEEETGRTPLNVVCGLYDVELAPTLEILDLLLRHGADVHGGKGSETSLHKCVTYRKHPTEVVRFLLQRGANPNKLCHAGWPPLHKLLIRKVQNPGDIKTEFFETVKVLLEAGADSNAVDPVGRTAVDIVYEMLAKKKPWLEKKLSPESTVWITAAVDAYSAILRILEDKGGRRSGM
jgi:ankyrin repeat protein